MKNLTNRLILGILLTCPVVFSGCAVALIGISGALGGTIIANDMRMLPNWKTIRPPGTPEAGYALSMAIAQRLGYAVKKQQFSEDHAIIIWEVASNESLTAGVEIKGFGDTRVEIEIRSSKGHEFDVLFQEFESNLSKLEDSAFQAWGTANWGDPSAAPLTL